MAAVGMLPSCCLGAGSACVPRSGGRNGIAFLPKAAPPSRWHMRHLRRYASKRNKGEAEVVPEMPLTEEECAAYYERVNKTLPASPLLKQALSIEEGAIAIAGRSFEIIAVVIMSMYGIKALQIGLYDGPTFIKFFFEGGAPDPSTSAAFNETFVRIRESLGQGILIGLEFLIISDIFESVSKPLEERTMQDLFKLGTVVLIRTVIDLSLKFEG